MTAAGRAASARIHFLADFCREHPLDEKTLVVPAFIVGRQIGESLARQAGSWINLRLVTPSTLAAEVLERSGGAGSARPMSSPSELALTDRLFRTLLAEGKLEYFGRAGASPGLVHALHRAVRDLRLAGLTSADIRPERFLVESKGRELALLLERFERALAADGLYDRPALLGRAVKAAAVTAPSSGWILGLRDVRLSRLEAELVRAVGGDRLVLVPGDPVFGLQRPRHFWPAGPVEDGREAGPLSWLFAPGEAPSPRGDGGVDIFRALGPANECREILRRLYAEATPFDHVEILTPPGSAHATVFHLLSTRTGLPVTFGDGIPVSFSSPGRLFFGLADWLASDFSSDVLSRLIERGDLVLPTGGTGPPLAARTACRHLRAAMIGWGRDRYASRLRALRESKEADLRSLAADEGGDALDAVEARRAGRIAAIAEIDGLAAAVGRLLSVIPEAGAGGAYDFQALCDAFSRVLRDHGRAETDLDRRALEALLVRLAEVLSEGRFPPLALNEVLGLIRAAGTSLRVGASPPLPGRLHIAAYSSGGYSGRPVTFVAGLDEAAFPGRGLQDPVLLDEERNAISNFLPTAADVLRVNLFGLAATLASLRGRVLFSYSSYDIIEGRESFPSSVVLQAFRLCRRDPGLDYAALETGLPEASGFLPGRPDRAVDDLDWWLDRLTAADPRPDGPRTIAANFADLASGLAAAAARAGDALTAYEGIVDLAPLRAEVDPVAGRKAVMSATRLELLAKCPFAYFLRHVLMVEPPEEVEFDRARWLDPLQRGSLVHEILCEFMTAVAGSGEEVSSARHGAALARVGAGRIARTREKIPPPSEMIFESERRDLLETLEIFLAAEEKREDKGRPFAFEREIRREEIALGGGRSFRLNGFIDRVDELGRDLYRIIDYKTGSPAAYEDLVEFGRGRTLQPALYAVSLEQILARERPGSKPRVAASGYLFPSRRGEGHEIMLRGFDRDRLRRLLNDLLGLLERGTFIAGPEAKCDHCDYAGVCVSGGPGRAERKRAANPAIFEAYDKLDEYK
jgi:RecB family exonuclease